MSEYDVNVTYEGDAAMAARWIGFAKSKAKLLGAHCAGNSLPYGSRWHFIDSFLKIHVRYIDGIQKAHIIANSDLHGIVVWPYTSSFLNGWGEPYTEDNSPMGTAGGNYPTIIFQDNGNYELGDPATTIAKVLRGPQHKTVYPGEVGARYILASHIETYPWHTLGYFSYPSVTTGRYDKYDPTRRTRSYAAAFQHVWNRIVGIGKFAGKYIIIDVSVADHVAYTATSLDGDNLTEIGRGVNYDVSGGAVAAYMFTSDGSKAACTYYDPTLGGTYVNNYSKVSTRLVEFSQDPDTGEIMATFTKHSTNSTACTVTITTTGTIPGLGSDPIPDPDSETTTDGESFYVSRFLSAFATPDDETPPTNIDSSPLGPHYTETETEYVLDAQAEVVAILEASPDIDDVVAQPIEVYTTFPSGVVFWLGRITYVVVSEGNRPYTTRVFVAVYHSQWQGFSKSFGAYSASQAGVYAGNSILAADWVDGLRTDVFGNNIPTLVALRCRPASSCVLTSNISLTATKELTRSGRLYAGGTQNYITHFSYSSSSTRTQEFELYFAADMADDFTFSSQIGSVVTVKSGLNGTNSIADTLDYTLASSTSSNDRTLERVCTLNFGAGSNIYTDYIRAYDIKNGVIAVSRNVQALTQTPTTFSISGTQTGGVDVHAETVVKNDLDLLWYGDDGDAQFNSGVTPNFATSIAPFKTPSGITVSSAYTETMTAYKRDLVAGGAANISVTPSGTTNTSSSATNTQYTLVGMVLDINSPLWNAGNQFPSYIVITPPGTTSANFVFDLDGDPPGAFATHKDLHALYYWGSSGVVDAAWNGGVVFLKVLRDTDAQVTGLVKSPIQDIIQLNTVTTQLPQSKMFGVV